MNPKHIDLRTYRNTLRALCEAIARNAEVPEPEPIQTARFAALDLLSDHAQIDDGRAPGSTVENVLTKAMDLLDRVMECPPSFIPNEYHLEAHRHPSGGGEFWVYRIRAGVLSSEDVGCEFQMASETPWDWRYAMPVKSVRHHHGQVSIGTGTRDEGSVTVSADNELYLRPLADEDLVQEINDFLSSDDNDDEPVWTITRGDLKAAAGSPLRAGDFDRFAEAFGNSTVGETIETVIGNIVDNRPSMAGDRGYITSPVIEWDRVDSFIAPDTLAANTQKMVMELHQKSTEYSRLVACLIQFCRDLAPIVRPEHQNAFNDLLRDVIQRDHATQEWLASATDATPLTVAEIEKGAVERLRSLYAAASENPILVDQDAYRMIQDTLRHLDGLTS